MQKILLSLLFALTVKSAFSQVLPCPTDIFRENGGGADCRAYAQGTGKLRISFAVAPDPSVQVFIVFDPTSGQIATVVPESKEVTQQGTTYRWCFKSNNIQDFKAVQVQIFLDNGAGGGIAFNGIPDGGEVINRCASQGSLPVTLLNFNAKSRSGKVTLAWETATEINNEGFVVERKVGNGVYEKIGFVKSKAPGGNGENYSYSFEDNNPSSKAISNYRLAQTDYDGKITYSEIRSVRIGSDIKLAMSVYPNPSNGTMNVALPEEGMFDVSVFDFSGRQVKYMPAISSKNFQILNLKPGIYTITVTDRISKETLSNRITVN